MQVSTMAGEPEVTAPYACIMTRQWCHRGQVTLNTCYLCLTVLFEILLKPGEFESGVTTNFQFLVVFFPSALSVEWSTKSKRFSCVSVRWHRSMRLSRQDLATGITVRSSLKQIYRFQVHRFIKLPSLISWNCDQKNCYEQGKSQWRQSPVENISTPSDEITGEWYKLHNDVIHGLYFSSSVMRSNESERMRCYDM